MITCQKVNGSPLHYHILSRKNKKVQIRIFFSKFHLSGQPLFLFSNFIKQDFSNESKRHLMEKEKKKGLIIPDWTVVRKLIQNLQLFKCYLINLVHSIDARYIYPTTLDNIYEVISSCIVSKRNISIVNSVFATYCLHSFKIQICVGNCRCEINPTLIFLPEGQIWWFLV